MSEQKQSGFGARLRQLREAAGLTQEALAEQAGMHKFGIAKLERGEREPSWATVKTLAKALGVNCLAFEGDDEGDQREEAPRPRGRPKKSNAPSVGGQTDEQSRPASAKGTFRGQEEEKRERKRGMGKK
jgi:transcriptional regulator with XRE-family HTH domain